MSIAGLATLAAVRDTRAPVRSDLGKEEPQPATAESVPKKPTNLDIAVTAIPTGAVTIYTAWIALVAASVKAPTAENPSPNLYEPLRWIGFLVLIAVTAGLIIKEYRAKSGDRKLPGLELAVGLVAAAGWGLAMPESPLVPRLGEDYGVLVPGLITLVAAGFVLVFSNELKSATT